MRARCRDAEDTAVSGDLAALAGMPLESLCVSAAISWLLAPLFSSASFADGSSGACACRNVYGTAVSGDVAALAGMPLTVL